MSCVIFIYLVTCSFEKLNINYAYNIAIIQKIVINHKILQYTSISIQINIKSTYNTDQIQYITTQHGTEHNNTTIE